MRRYWIARGVKFVVFAALAVMVASGVVMMLWNWVMPATFGLPVLTLGRAFASTPALAPSHARALGADVARGA